MQCNFNYILNERKFIYYLFIHQLFNVDQRFIKFTNITLNHFFEIYFSSNQLSCRTKTMVESLRFSLVSWCLSIAQFSYITSLECINLQNYN